MLTFPPITPDSNQFTGFYESVYAVVMPWSRGILKKVMNASFLGQTDKAVSLWTAMEDVNYFILTLFWVYQMMLTDEQNNIEREEGYYMAFLACLEERVRCHGFDPSPLYELLPPLSGIGYMRIDINFIVR